jgi:5'-nucleotidase (lipoprotein e(P4) family)
LIISDVTDQLTDTDRSFEHSAWYSVPRLQAFFLGSEGDHRVKTLFSDPGKEKCATGLGREILGRQAYLMEQLTGDDVCKAEFIYDACAFLAGGGTCAATDRRRAATRFVNQLYYTAKNWTYTQDTYFQEMETIQRRIDFSRSVFLLASWALVLLPFALMIALAGLWARLALPEELRRKGRRITETGFVDPHDPLTYRGATLRVAKLMVLLAAICWIAQTGYGGAEEIFNERAYGYHISALNERAPKPEPDRLQALAWMMTSAEYEAICRQTYADAREFVARAKASLNDRRTTRPLAVVLDLDETVLNTAVAFNQYLLEKRLPYNETLWRRWNETQAEKISAVPGAKDFLDGLARSGVEPVFITNRDESLRDETIAVLRSLGLWSGPLSSHQLLMAVSGERGKERRRKEAEARYEILAFVGDNLADFAEVFEHERSGGYADRTRLVGTTFGDRWGQGWFVLPNPVYGDWTQALTKADRAVLFPSLAAVSAPAF